MKFFSQVILMIFFVYFVSDSYAAPVLCRGEDNNSVIAAQRDAKDTLKAVVNYLIGSDANTVALVKRWFGKNDQKTIKNVSSTLAKTGDWVDKFTAYCIYQNDGSLVEKVIAPDGSLVLHDRAGDVYAYVLVGDISKVNFGLRFYTAPPLGRDSKLGTIIHEITHYFITGNTNDHEYGKEMSLEMALQHPEKAIKNADNFQYFVEEWLIHKTKQR